MFSSNSKKIILIIFIIFALQILFAGAVLAAEKPKIRLQVPIPGTDYDKPGQEYSLDIADYIGAIYNYAVSIAGIIAIIMIAVGGVIWLMAGGNANQVTKAKEYIFNALIGLFLVLGSWIILNTINPALLTLKVPEIKTIEGMKEICCLDEKTGQITKTPVLEEGGKCSEGQKEVPCPVEMADGEACYTKRDAEACKRACEGCECRPIQKETLMNQVIAISTAIDAGLLIGGMNPGAIASLAKKGVKLSWEGIKFSIRHWKGTLLAGVPAGGGAGLGALYWSATHPDLGQPGVCMAMPKNLPAGSICDPGSQQCAPPGKCIVGNILIGWGVCTSGKEGEPCKSGGDCISPLKCVADDLSGLSWCVDPTKKAQTGYSCSGNDDCLSGVCAYGSKTCVTGTEGRTGGTWYQSPCGFNNKCAGGYSCNTSRLVCEASGAAYTCKVNPNNLSEVIEKCPGGYTCEIESYTTGEGTCKAPN